MPLYDFLAPAYDLVFEEIYRPFRSRALERLPFLTGATVLDLACGTGQNLPLLAERVGTEGRIIGVDISRGMLRRARNRAQRMGLANVSFMHMDAAKINALAFRAQIDFVACTYGFTAMPGWQHAFRASWTLLKPGGSYLIHDIDAATPTLHSRAIEFATRCHFSEKVWQPLQAAALDFRMDYLDPSAHLFGGRLFVATGTKPP